MQLANLGKSVGTRSRLDSLLDILTQAHPLQSVGVHAGEMTEPPPLLPFPPPPLSHCGDPLGPICIFDVYLRSTKGWESRRKRASLQRHCQWFLLPLTCNCRLRLLVFFWSSYHSPPFLGTADAEIKVSSVENSELSKVLPLKPRVGQTIVTHASPSAENSVPCSVYLKNLSTHSFCLC